MNDKLTIVMVSMHTSPLAQPGQGDAGGMNVYIHNLTTALIRAGHQVLSFTRKTSSSEIPVVLDETTDSWVIPVAAGQLHLPKEALSGLTTQFAQAMMSHVANHAQHRVVLHSHYWLSGLAALHVAQQLAVPVVHTMHTLAAAKNSSSPGAEPAFRVEREAFLGAKVSTIIANTRVERDELVSYAGVDPARIAVVHPGVDHRVFSPTGSATWPGKTRQGAAKILFAGRMQPFKGPHVLVEALAVLHQQGYEHLPVVHFTGSLSGQQHYDVRSRAYLLGVAPYCSFSKPVAPAVLADYMRAADVVAVPSVAESFGLVAMEAQACGTPVLAHRAGGLTTVVEHGVTGKLVDSRDPHVWAEALIELMEHPGRWRQYGLAAERHAQQFSWTAMADSMLEIYQTAPPVG